MQHIQGVESNLQSTQEQAVLSLASRQALLRARDLAQQEIPTVVLSRLVAAGMLERVSRGVYALPGAPFGVPSFSVQ